MGLRGGQSSVSAAVSFPVALGLWSHSEQLTPSATPSLGMSVSALGRKNLERGGRERKESRVRGDGSHTCVNNLSS